MKSFLSVFFLVALSTCLVYSFKIPSEKYKNSALRRLKRSNDLKLPEHQRPGNEVKKCDGDVSSWKKNNLDYDGEIIRDKFILPQLFHLNKEKFERCVMCEVISRDTRADGEITNSDDSFDIELSKSTCMNGDNFDKPDNLLLERLQALVASDFERERVLACTSVALQDAGIDEELIETAYREKIRRLYENILKCSEGDYYPLTRTEASEVNCFVKHLKSRKMLNENFNLSIERADEMTNCDDYLKAFEETIYKDAFDGWTAEDLWSRFFNKPHANEKFSQCVTDELKLRGYADLKLKEKLFGVLQISRGYLRDQQKLALGSRRACGIAKIFDAAFDAYPRDMFEKAALDDYVVSIELLGPEGIIFPDFDKKISECTSRTSAEEGFGNKIAALYALGQLNISDQQKQFERTKFMSSITNLTEKVVKCSTEELRNFLSNEDEIRINCIVKDLKMKNVLDAEFLEFNQTYDAENCHDQLERIKNEITEGSYDGCSVDELNSGSNWDHLFKLSVPVFEDMRNEKLAASYMYQMEQILSRKCGLEKLFRSLLNHPMNSSKIGGGKTEARCIKKYVIDKKLIDTEKFNVTLGSADIDATKCEAILEKKTKEINFRSLQKFTRYTQQHDMKSWCALPKIRDVNIPDKIFAAQALASVTIDKQQKEVERQKFAKIAKDLALAIYSCEISWSQA